MFLEPNNLKESDPNRANRSAKGIGSHSVTETMRMSYASMIGAGVFVFLLNRVSTPLAFTIGLATAIGFYALITNIKLPDKK